MQGADLLVVDDARQLTQAIDAFTTPGL
jgi:hypothetical protein